MFQLPFLIYRGRDVRAVPGPPDSPGPPSKSPLKSCNPTSGSSGRETKPPGQRGRQERARWLHSFQLSAEMTFVRTIPLGRNAIRKRPAKEPTRLNCFHLCHQLMSFVWLASGYRSNLHCDPRGEGGNGELRFLYFFPLIKKKRKRVFSLKNVKRSIFTVGRLELKSRQTLKRISGVNTVAVSLLLSAVGLRGDAQHHPSLSNPAWRRVWQLFP